MVFDSFLVMIIMLKVNLDNILWLSHKTAATAIDMNESVTRGAEPRAV